MSDAEEKYPEARTADALAAAHAAGVAEATARVVKWLRAIADKDQADLGGGEETQAAEALRACAAAIARGEHEKAQHG